MFSLCTIRFRNFIYFTFFIFIVGLIPHLGDLLPDKFNLTLTTAVAAEEQVSGAQPDNAPEKVEGGVQTRRRPHRRKPLQAPAWTL